ncbi:2-phosphosulfolactate phosphatase [Marinitoga hydrogenitolerans DSM 16785]|uniref:Probable 2-phosphosulfolactate phosphatase n=1 Tax=Marinitoga hydrogenitolerans (strain DSM 16785 / JCM 12826 / AT1271) TaxID=1122195 RepID=A0A1M4SX33_MARH1|nr:2-phosphosulfolactate phosphatase [Marinitoga hydrogenitolerans]SHE36709.1 2-phosphosulfolactate phosphatase [Marinitoga hydrogenitolerans DSM 16785]
MRLYTYFLPEISVETHKYYVVIDTLRATSTIATALSVGAEYISVVDNPDEAFKIKEDNTLLVGERNAMKISGFDYSNSPSEILKNAAHFKDKKIVLCTTNGSKALLLANSKGITIATSLLNLKATLQYLIAKKIDDIGIICSGTDGRVSLEDVFTAGRILSVLSKQDITYFNDESYIALNMANIPHTRIMQYSTHSQKLKKIGLDKDLTMCFNESLLNVVPISKMGKNCFKSKIDI